MVSAASPCMYWRFISWRYMTGTSSVPCPISPSLVPERFDRIETRGAPRGIERSEERQRERHDHNRRRLAEIDLCRQAGQEIKLRREQLGRGEPGQELPDRFDVEADDEADEETGQRPHHADRSPGDQEDPHDR